MPHKIKEKCHCRGDGKGIWYAPLGCVILGVHQNENIKAKESAQIPKFFLQQLWVPTTLSSITGWNILLRSSTGNWVA